MGQQGTAAAVRLFFGLLAIEENLALGRELLAERYGASELDSPVWEFTQSDYYTSEMGKGLMRQFVSPAGVMATDELVRVKGETNSIEKECDKGVGRLLNIDPGYLSEAKVVLASTKDYAHRLHLGRGIYGEVTLSFRSGEYRPLEHTYPDYRSKNYRNYFKRLRELFVAGKRESLV